MLSSNFIKDSVVNDIEKIEILHKRFVKGLKEDYGMTDEEVKKVEDEWVYCGHRTKDEATDTKGLFKQYFPNIPIPDFEPSCICRKCLTKNNHWITDKHEVLIIGQCCKDMFIKHRLRSCNRCDKEHRNRKDNYCHDCRKLNKQSCNACNDSGIMYYMEDTYGPCIHCKKGKHAKFMSKKN